MHNEEQVGQNLPFVSHGDKYSEWTSYHNIITHAQVKAKATDCEACLACSQFAMVETEARKQGMSFV